MTTRAALVIVAVSGCHTYFGDQRAPTPIPPDAWVARDSGGVCPASAPEADGSCSHHQTGLLCSYEDTGPLVLCRCAHESYRWQCAEARFDAGVDAPRDGAADL
jgi:hypothetical protein